MKAFFALVLALVLVATPATAWWCGGHMLVAEIAYQNVDSNVQTFVDNIASTLSKSGPFDKSPTFMEMACWADDIKHNIGVMEGWHFIDIPYNPDNITIPSNSIDVENVEYVIVKFGSSLKHESQMNDWELGFSLANYVHMFGDAHQPLHCATLFNSQFPNGDRGGNLFHVTFQGKSQALHAVWDSVGGLYDGDDRPLSSSDRSKYEQDAKDLASKYTFPSSKTSVFNATVIGSETNMLAQTQAYAGIQPGDTLSSTYVSNCQDVAQSQITLGGLRLANQLTYFFKTAQRHGVVERLAKRREALRRAQQN